MADPARCVVLVPVGGAIEAGCEEGLRELERRGHPVRRVRGYSAIDAARCQMATDALNDGFEELMWIDSDVVFDPNDIDKLRAHAGRDVQRFVDYTFHVSDADTRAVAPVVKPKVAPTAGFSEDWFSRHVPVWQELFGPLAGTECHVLEVGVYEGRSTVWLLENILTHPASTLTYVDTFTGGIEHKASDLANLESRFLANTAAHRTKLVSRKGRSDEMLRDLPRGKYDFVSIDGSHEAADVLSDAVLSWPLVKPGGLVCFDDYEWWIDAAPERSPKLAIDAFLAVMRGRYEVVRKGYQLWVRKQL